MLQALLADRFQLAFRKEERPLSAYALDYHVDVGVTNPDGIPPMIAQWAAAQMWNLTSFLVKSVIDLFTWAFSLDLLNGPVNRPWGVRTASFADPGGHIWEIAQELSRADGS